MGSHSFQQSTLPSITARLISIKLEWNFTSIDRNIWPWTILSIIMVNEQSGVQFRLKSYAWFENQTSTQHGLKSKVRFQTKVHDTKFNYHVRFYIHFEIAKFSRSTDTGFFSLYKNFIDLVPTWFVKSCRSCLSVSCSLIGYSHRALRSDWFLFFLVNVLISWEKDAL